MKRYLLSILLVGVGLLSVVISLNNAKPVDAMALAIDLIKYSGLPANELDDGSTNEITRGRDYVDAYRYAHQQLYVHGSYRGLSADHIPLLDALVEALKSEGYTSQEKDKVKQTAEVLKKFWDYSDNQNATELGYEGLSDLQTEVEILWQSDKKEDKDKAKKIMDDLDKKWK